MQTTIGQRIAEERKRLGLSQEALGEQVGVSRQAISKWESDAAIPEVDKLVAMSRLFGTPVGVLLGVEESGGEAAELTDRELDTLRKLVSGLSDREIAQQLGISYNTVRVHITSMLQKTGFSSRTELALKAAKSGIVVPE